MKSWNYEEIKSEVEFCIKSTFVFLRKTFDGTSGIWVMIVIFLSLSFLYRKIPFHFVY